MLIDGVSDYSAKYQANEVSVNEPQPPKREDRLSYSDFYYH